VSCPDLAPDVLDLARGTAQSEDVRERVRAHLGGCPACAFRLEQERQLSAALGALSDSDATREAPPALEARLRDALRAAHRRPAPPRRAPDRLRWATLAAVAASLAAAAVVWRRDPPAPPPAPSEWVREALDGDDADDFLPVTFDDAAGGLDAVQVVRVRLPRSAMGSLGLVVSHDPGQGPVEADVLVGQDGLPRAIRFVSQSEPTSSGPGGTLQGGSR
jgi:hypothetical protein